MHRYGGCGIVSSGTHYSQVQTTTFSPQGTVDADAFDDLLPERAEQYAPSTSESPQSCPVQAFSEMVATPPSLEAAHTVRQQGEGWEQKEACDARDHDYADHNGARQAHLALAILEGKGDQDVEGGVLGEVSPGDDEHLLPVVPEDIDQRHPGSGARLLYAPFVARAFSTRIV
jgi:hypothetical protein